MTIKWTPADADELERRNPAPAPANPTKKSSTKKG
jgi:hypothetical protein